MLDKWLFFAERNPSKYKKFRVIDVEELDEVVIDEIKPYLTSLLQDALVNPESLRKAAGFLGFENAQKLYLKPRIPDVAMITKGVFGEVLISAILEQFHNYRVPIKKLRFRIVNNKSPFGTDVLALKLNDEDSIIEVCYVESKLRTGTDNNVGVEGYDQLEKDYDNWLPDIINFTYERLLETNDPLAGPFTMYLHNRSNSKDIDTFQLSLCWDKAAWKETVLENIEEYEEFKVPNLSVHVINIKELTILIKDLFNNIGMEIDINGES
jgi:hypothetical protein